MPPKNVFTIAPGAPFLECFVGALLDGRIVAGFSRALSAARTSRTRRSMCRRSARRAHLPTNSPARSAAPRPSCPASCRSAALEATENDLLFAMPGFAAPDAAPAAGGRRYLAADAARRVSSISGRRALHGAIVSIDADGRRDADPREPCLVGTSAADAWHLARRTCRPDRRIDHRGCRLGRSSIRSSCRTSINIGASRSISSISRSPQWPSDSRRAQSRRCRAAAGSARSRRKSRRSRPGTAKGPVIAIGSTGTNRATARLLAALAAAPHGAVVLPGLDLDLDETAWAADRRRRMRAIPASAIRRRRCAACCRSSACRARR